MSPGALAVAGHLRLRGPGIRLSVEGRRDRLALHVPDRRTLWRLWRIAAGPGRHRGRLDAVDAALSRAGLAAELILGGRSVARVGHGVRSSTVARWLGLAPARLRLVPLLTAVLGLPGTPRRSFRSTETT